MNAIYARRIQVQFAFKAGYDGVSTIILAGHPNLKLHNRNDNFTFIDHTVNHYKYIVTKCPKDYKSSSKADANYA